VRVLSALFVLEDDQTNIKVEGDSGSNFISTVKLKSNFSYLINLFGKGTSAYPAPHELLLVVVDLACVYVLL